MIVHEHSYLEFFVDARPNHYQIVLQTGYSLLKLTVYRVLESENKLWENVEITPDDGLMLNKFGARSSPIME